MNTRTRLCAACLSLGSGLLANGSAAGGPPTATPAAGAEFLYVGDAGNQRLVKYQIVER